MCKQVWEQQPRSGRKHQTDDHWQEHRAKGWAKHGQVLSTAHCKPAQRASVTEDATRPLWQIPMVCAASTTIAILHSFQSPFGEQRKGENGADEQWAV